MSVLVSRKAPDFTTAAVLSDGKIVNQFNFYEAKKDKYAIVFFYPLDFTFVCPSELIALEHRMKDFQDRNVLVVAVSIDSHFTHNAWRNTPTHEGGIGPVSFTMAADMNHHICQAYGVEHPQVGVAFRGAFIVDKNNVVRSQIVNDLPLGRNVDELLRLLDALEYHEQHGEVCPAGWQKGKPGMQASPEGVANYLANHSEHL